MKRYVWNRAAALVLGLVFLTGCGGGPQIVGEITPRPTAAQEQQPLPTSSPTALEEVSPQAEAEGIESVEQAIPVMQAVARTAYCRGEEFNGAPTVDFAREAAAYLLCNSSGLMDLSGTTLQTAEDGATLAPSGAVQKALDACFVQTGDWSVEAGGFAGGGCMDYDGETGLYRISQPAGSAVAFHVEDWLDHGDGIAIVLLTGMDERSGETVASVEITLTAGEDAPFGLQVRAVTLEEEAPAH